MALIGWGLPQELIDMIKTLIIEGASPPDLGIMRCVSRAWEQVATPLLFSEAVVIFKEKSFANLLDISRHPHLSKYVEEIVYQPDMVHEIDLKEWEQVAQRARSIPKDSSMHKCWLRYLEYIKEQRYLKEERRYCVIEFTSALMRLSNVKTINMDYGFGLSGITDRPWRRDLYRGKKPFKDALVNAGAEDDDPSPGASEMKALISAIHVADLRLTCLRLGFVHWAWMKDAFMRDTMEQIVPSLETLELGFGTGIDQETEECGIDIADCAEFLMTEGWLERLMSLAPDLKSLSVSFDWHDPASPAHLQQVVSDLTWKELEHVCLEKIDADADELIQFFQRHKRTLKRVHLEDLRLIDGSWIDVLEAMEKVLSLEDVWIYGQLMAEEQVEFWSLWPEHDKFGTQEAIHKFLLHGGKCPLRDAKKHPQSWRED